ncbi:MAG: type I methionyl aminopeptidase [Treponema sp.]|nr:type I methionyl aminopeptidase [Treponema sp.]
MIKLKTEKQIDGIRVSCKMLSAMYRELIPQVKPGVQTIDIDFWVRNWVKQAGAKPAFLGYCPRRASDPFPAAICISINSEVIHGIPSKRKIREGDLVGLDCGIEYDGFFSDQAISIEAGRVSREVHDLNITARECLYRGIAAVKAGDRLLQVARAVEGHAKARGYGIVREYCGHGVGFSLHEDPQVPNYPHGPNPRMSNGMVFAIEPMINGGSGDVELKDDGWTVITADRCVSAHWEHTVAIFQGKTEILTDPLE